MDLVRNLPRLDRSRFTVVVCTLQSRGTLATQLTDKGIEVVGPNLARSPNTSMRVRAFYGISHSCQYLLKEVPAWLAPHLISVGLRYLDFALPVADYVSSGDFDVIHTMSPSAYITGVIANSLIRRRALLMSRVSLNFYQRNSRFFGTIERAFHHRADLVIGNSEAILRELRIEGIPDRKLLLVHNGIDFADFTNGMVDRQQARARLGISQTALVLTSVANLFPYKGHADLLSALQLVRGRLAADWILLVAGRDIDGNLAKLRRSADEWGLGQHVRFLGERQDIPTILSASDIHISASHYEGFPNNILEAMCAGLPVVATAVGGVTEQIAGGCTGYLVPPCDPEALGAALYALACDSSCRLAMGKRARLRVEGQFPIDHSVAAFEQAYASLAGLRARRRS
jgi:glycosyltransferase involved in cell wall biosynthesis